MLSDHVVLNAQEAVKLAVVAAASALFVALALLPLTNYERQLL